MATYQRPPSIFIEAMSAEKWPQGAARRGQRLTQLRQPLAGLSQRGLERQLMRLIEFVWYLKSLHRDVQQAKDVASYKHDQERKRRLAAEQEVQRLSAELEELRAKQQQQQQQAAQAPPAAPVEQHSAAALPPLPPHHAHPRPVPTLLEELAWRTSRRWRWPFARAAVQSMAGLVELLSGATFVSMKDAATAWNGIQAAFRLVADDLHSHLKQCEGHLTLLCRNLRPVQQPPYQSVRGYVLEGLILCPIREWLHHPDDESDMMVEDDKPARDGMLSHVQAALRRATNEARRKGSTPIGGDASGIGVMTPGATTLLATLGSCHALRWCNRSVEAVLLRSILDTSGERYTSSTLHHH
ncbi:unnamed protein product [Vitrella brassicaformis CCMP3155]|uniref:Uncharacterized protein n=1 Tax=Vitrella brassicaformis (strain CCMP3155) TaxID=1169540 RepID=A0A0G4EF42_VITBC|nr:unnamed protein product [Vitrella brassicaformis CCMP3155]|eukprot:CEL94139.1 unnamed protein product [Vitrella brassicaformis CCMP3155]